MGLNLVIKDLPAHKLEKSGIKCVECSFWFDYEEGAFLEELYGTRSLSDVRYFFRRRFKHPDYGKNGQKKLVTFVNKGGIVKGVFKDRKCVGLLMAGSYEIFPKLRSFNIFPPDPESIFLGCIYKKPKENGDEINKRLLIELGKDLLKKNIAAIETVGKRLDEDVSEKEFENSSLLSFKFLINNGFYLKKNDKHFPLLRLDLKSIAKDFAGEKLSMAETVYKKTVRNPVVIREK